MSRKGQAPKRVILPDPKFGSDRLAKFINIIMLDGKKSVAEKIMYGAIDALDERNKDKDSMEVLELHFKTPHMAAFGAAMGQIQPSSMDVKLYEVAGELALPR